MSRQSDFVSEVRHDAQVLIRALDRLRSKQGEWNALDYGNTLDVASLEGHEGITTAQIGAVVFDTVTAIDAVLAQGHATNVHRVR